MGCEHVLPARVAGIARGPHAEGVDLERQTEEVNEPIVHVIVDDLERLDVPGKKLSSRSRDFH